MRVHVIALAAVLCTSCVAFSVDAKRVQYVRDARFRAERSHGETEAVLMWGRELAGVLETGTLKRGNLSMSDVDAAVVALDAITDKRGEALAVRGKVLTAADRPDEAVVAFEASLSVGPNMTALHYILPLLVERGQKDVAIEHCRKTRNSIKPGELNLLLSTCERSIGLAWTSPQDRARLKNTRASDQAAVQENADRRADQRECQARIRAAERAGDLPPSCRR